jgi:hypothetical protein
MKIDKDIRFRRVHRMGKRVNGRKRAINAKLVNYKATDTVKIADVTALNRQTRRKFGVSEQYLKEENEKRKQLYPHFKAAKRRTNDQNLCMTSCMLIERNLLLQ